MPDDPYAVAAEVYDLVHAPPDDDVGLWLSFAGRTDRPVLEVGTGTGRIALALVRVGHEVVAIDPSPVMLARARQKAEDDGLEVELIEGKVTDLSLEAGRYGFAVVPADVFLYCVDGDEQLATLESLGRCLHFNGVLAVDLPGPAAWLDPSSNGQPLLVFAGDDEAGEALETWHVHEDDLALQTRALRVTYERTGADGLLRRTRADHFLRYVYRFEMEYLVRLAGLQLLDVYGDYDLGPLTNDSERMIFTARRKDA